VKSKTFWGLNLSRRKSIKFKSAVQVIIALKLGGTMFE
jgi:hypothetical protein